jgi:hypothetical protein
MPYTDPRADLTADGLAATLLPAGFTLTAHAVELAFTAAGVLEPTPVLALGRALGVALRALSPPSGAPGGDDPTGPFARLFHPPGNLAPPILLELAPGFPGPAVAAGAVGRAVLTCFTGQPDDLASLGDALRRVGERGAGIARFVVRPLLPHPANGITRDDVLALAQGFREQWTVRVHYQTPTAITIAGQRRNHLTFAELIAAILNRLHAGLGAHYGAIDLHDRCRAARRALLALADAVACTEEDTRWAHELRPRYRRAPQEVSGFVGRQRYTGDLTPFWPLLVAGSLVHIGSNTFYDRGRYSLEVR